MLGKWTTYKLQIVRDTVAESGVWLLAAQNLVKKQGWWEGKCALFWMPATQGEGESRHLSKG